MSIDPNSRNRPRCGWAVYYADQRIAITSWYVQTRGDRYPVTELADVLRVLTNTYPGRRVALVAGGVEVGVALPLTVAYQSTVMLLVGLIAAAGVAAGVLTDARRNPRWMELRATYRGEDVLLFSSRNSTEFEQVRRALVRAVEVNRDLLP